MPVVDGNIGHDDDDDGGGGGGGGGGNGGGGGGGGGREGREGGAAANDGDDDVVEHKHVQIEETEPATSVSNILAKIAMRWSTCAAT